ncbi:hypothetical protein KIN20_003926 [Parelaphostrongylus tenuis]|uniref:Uncharacterized protein n=1 Tax=Parelaphostrongylus tenuis TaxID=148309 RepID=A0AAD5M0Z7_PARTN|nr:hypothetical protein KIN20_003926 [Parelaphostrongylus tenuis]
MLLRKAANRSLMTDDLTCGGNSLHEWRLREQLQEAFKYVGSADHAEKGHLGKYDIKKILQMGLVGNLMRSLLACIMTYKPYYV